MSHPHLDALAASLLKEMEAVAEEHRRIEALPLPTRVAMGQAWHPLEIDTVEHRSKGRVNVLLRGRDLHEGIGPGDPVWLSPGGRREGALPGRCEGADRFAVELRVDGAPEGRGPWAVWRRLDQRQLEEERQRVLGAHALRGALPGLLLGRDSPYRADPWDDPAFDGLDPSQREAAALALGATEIGLIHGPPGTGKTRVLVAILAALKARGEKAWALAESNAAVDHLALRASAAGLDVVRLGVSARIGSAVQPLTLEHRILHGARAEVIQKLLRAAVRASGEEEREIRQAINEEWQAAKREILANADAVAMTLGTLQTRGQDLAAPKTALVDEAGQIRESTLWTLPGRVKRIILAGDPLQLGPVLQSRDPLLATSLLERLVREGFQFPMLRRQYRMSDALLGLCNPTYGGRLESAPEVADRPIPGAPGLWTSGAARFIDTAGLGMEEQRDDTGSLYNEGELRLLARALQGLAEAGVPADQIAIITPYSAQLRRIQARHPQIESGTVNAFQGREREVVIASFVRSNPEREVGFVADPRRLNVSLSRARGLFIGIGDSETLGSQPMFRRLVEAVGDGYWSAWELEEG